MSTFAYRVSVDTVAAKQTLVVIPDNDYVQVPVLHRICSCFDPLPPPPSSIQFQLIISDQEPGLSGIYCLIRFNTSCLELAVELHFHIRIKYHLSFMIKINVKMRAQLIF